MNKTQVKKMLQESAFDPKDDFRFVTELENPDYCMCKAMEVIGKARKFDNKQLFLKQAISLLTIARIQLMLLFICLIGCNRPEPPVFTPVSVIEDFDYTYMEKQRELEAMKLDLAIQQTNIDLDKLIKSLEDCDETLKDSK